MCDWVTAYSPFLLFSYSSYNWTPRNVLSVLCNSWCVAPFTSPPSQTVPETGWLTVRLLSKLHYVISRYFNTTNIFFCDKNKWNLGWRNRSFTKNKSTGGWFPFLPSSVSKWGVLSVGKRFHNQDFLQSLGNNTLERFSIGRGLSQWIRFQLWSTYLTDTSTRKLCFMYQKMQTFQVDLIDELATICAVFTVHAHVCRTLVCRTLVCRIHVYRTHGARALHSWCVHRTRTLGSSPVFLI